MLICTYRYYQMVHPMMEMRMRMRSKMNARDEIREVMLTITSRHC